MKPALAERAVEMAGTIEPSRERWLDVADARAGSLDVKGAERALATALRRPWKHRDLGLLERVRRNVAAAAVADRALPADAPDGALLKKARALMTLDRYEDVIKLLGASRDRERVRQHAGLAATLAVATLDAAGVAECPIDSESPLAHLCSWAINDDPVVKQTVETLRSAWQSGRGRDSWSASTYVGLLYVLPFSRDLSEAYPNPTEVQKRTADLEAALVEAEKISPALGGVRLCVDAIRLTLAHHDGASLWPSSDARAEFRARALEIAKRDGANRRGQEGVTCAAVLLAHDENSSSLFNALPEHIEPALRLTRANVRLWTALIEHDPRSADAAAAQLLKALPGKHEPEARAATMLEAGEVQAAVTGSSDAYQELGMVAKKINRPGFSSGLRLRATIDLAGIRSRSGDPDGAVKLLLSISAQDKAQAPGMAGIADIYALALQGKAAHGEARQSFIDRLQKVSAKDSGSPCRVWRDMWIHELQFLSAMDRCGKSAACVKRAARHRRLSDSEIDRRLGPWLAALTRRGTLTYTTFDPKLSYSTQAGLGAQVDFSFVAPAVEYPIN